MQPNETMLILATLVAGALTPFIVQLVKGTYGVKGDAALFLAFVVALLCGLGIALAGGATMPTWAGDPVGFVSSLGGLTGIVFTVATIIYKMWLAKLPEGTTFANKL